MVTALPPVHAGKLRMPARGRSRILLLCHRRPHSPPPAGSRARETPAPALRSAPRASASATATRIALDALDLHGAARRGLRLPRPQRRRQDDHDPAAARAAPAERRPRGAVRRRRLGRPGHRPPPRGLRRRRAVPVAVADERGDVRVPRPAARRHRHRLPRRAGRALPARHLQDGPRAVEGQPPEGAADRGARHPRGSADARRAHQRPGPADGGRLPRDCVNEAKERGQTVFLSSHILSEVEALCDRVGHPARGQARRRGHARRAAPPQRADGRGHVRRPRARAARRCRGCSVQSAGPNALRFEVTRQRRTARSRRSPSTRSRA